MTHNLWIIKYLTKVANKENFLKTLDPPESIMEFSNSELRKQKEDMITNANRIQRFAFFLIKTDDPIFRMTDKMTSFNETWSTTMDDVIRLRETLNVLSVKQSENKERTSTILGENH